jgi:hypothetical protein
MLTEKLSLLRLSGRISKSVEKMTRKEEICYESILIGALVSYHVKWPYHFKWLSVSLEQPLECRSTLIFNCTFCILTQSNLTILAFLRIQLPRQPMRIKSLTSLDPASQLTTPVIAQCFGRKDGQWCQRVTGGMIPESEREREMDIECTITSPVSKNWPKYWLPDPLSAQSVSNCDSQAMAVKASDGGPGRSLPALVDCQSESVRLRTWSVLLWISLEFSWINVYFDNSRIFQFQWTTSEM